MPIPSMLSSAVRNNAAGTCACAVAVAKGRAHAYNEEAFHYLLARERKRAERSGRPFLLVLVELKEAPPGVRHDRVAATRLFSGLWRCLRETDIIGWYRDQRVAGALLTELGDGMRTEASLTRRISTVICDVLPADAAHRLEVRVHRHLELATGDT